MQKIRYLVYLVLLVLLGGGIWWVNREWARRSKIQTTQNATVLLERIQKVAKWITVEGYFSELYENRSFQYFDVYPFQKKVLVRVKAKVSAGFDLETLSIETDEPSKTIWINALPEPTILSIDHDLDYYDISEGFFTSFSEADYNKIQSEAKEMIRKKASESNLLAEASAQGKDFLEMIRLIVEASGWQLKIRSRPEMKK